MNPKENKTSIPKRITLIFLGIFFCLALLEVGLRLGGFIFASLQEASNRRAFLKKDSYRILCLGESTTAHQYPPFLEEALNQRNIGIKFSVIDKGVPGINTIDILSHLEENLNTYKPDMVIAMMGNNDEQVTYYRNIPEANTGLFQHSSAYRFIRLLYMHIVHKLKKQDIHRLEKKPPKKNPALMETAGPGPKNSPASREPPKRTATINPGKYEEYIESGRAYLQQERFLEAEELFKKAIAINPGSDLAYVELGLICFYRKQSKALEPMEPLKKAATINPGNGDVHLGLKKLPQKQNEFPEAENFIKKAIAINPNNDWAYTVLGVVYQKQCKFSEAEASLKQAIFLNPRNDWAFARLGETYRQQGKIAEAEASLKQAIAINSSDDWKRAWECRALSSLYREMNKPGLAEEYRKKVIDGYSSITIENHLKLKVILDKRGIKLVCVQYPMRSVEPLREIFEGKSGVIFVDNEELFKKAVTRGGYKEYFQDMFAGDFGHCTDKGNKLLAENIANTVFKEVFGR